MFSNRNRVGRLFTFSGVLWLQFISELSGTLPVLPNVSEERAAHATAAASSKALEVNCASCLLSFRC